MKIKSIEEPWEAEIVVREHLDAICLVSQIANLLYPEIPTSTDRISRLRDEGGEIIQRLETVCAERARHCDHALEKWYNRKHESATQGVAG